MSIDVSAAPVTEQINELRGLGMSIDESAASHHFRHISFHRMQPYWKILENPNADGGKYLAGSDFRKVLNLYTFDRKLRLHVMDAIERVEISLRAQWSRHMANEYGPYGYLEESIYRNVNRLNADKSNLKSQHKRSKKNEPEMNIYDENSEYKFPPVWTASEVMSFSLLSLFIENLKHKKDHRAIGEVFGLGSHKELTSVVRHLTHIRNISAHHGLLWNRVITVKMKVPSRPETLAIAMKKSDPKYLYNSLVMLDYMLRIVLPNTEWRIRLVKHLDSCPLSVTEFMGFPRDWKEQKIWRVRNGRMSTS